jgi:hypothetical protein
MKRIAPNDGLLFYIFILPLSLSTLYRCIQVGYESLLYILPPLLFFFFRSFNSSLVLKRIDDPYDPYIYTRLYSSVCLDGVYSLVCIVILVSCSAPCIGFYGR